MIKKTVSIIMCLVLISLLCGCGGYREIDSCYIVTALGFDGGKKLKITVEVVSAGGSERSNEPFSEVFEEKGNTPEEALFLLNSKISKKLMFDHATAIVLGDDLTKQQVEDILDYGKKQVELNFAIYMLYSENAREIFKKADPISLACGYDIAGIIKEIRISSGIDYSNRFYEMYTSFKKQEKYGLPNVKVEDEKVVVEGQAVFYKDGKKTMLSNEESLIYSILANQNTGGSVCIGREKAELDESRTKYLKKSGKYDVLLFTKEKNDGFVKAFKKQGEKLLKKHGKALGFEGEKINAKQKGGI